MSHLLPCDMCEGAPGVVSTPEGMLCDECATTLAVELRPDGGRR